VTADGRTGAEAREERTKKGGGRDAVPGDDSGIPAVAATAEKDGRMLPEAVVHSRWNSHCGRGRGRRARA
jgi:hypothetical protein